MSKNSGDKKLQNNLRAEGFNPNPPTSVPVEQPTIEGFNSNPPTNAPVEPPIIDFSSFSPSLSPSQNVMLSGQPSSALPSIYPSINSTNSTGSPTSIFNPKAPVGITRTQEIEIAAGVGAGLLSLVGGGYFVRRYLNGRNQNQELDLNQRVDGPDEVINPLLEELENNSQEGIELGTRSASGNQYSALRGHDEYSAEAISNNPPIIQPQNSLDIVTQKLNRSERFLEQAREGWRTAEEKLAQETQAKNRVQASLEREIQAREEAETNQVIEIQAREEAERKLAEEQQARAEAERKLAEEQQARSEEVKRLTEEELQIISMRQGSHRDLNTPISDLDNKELLGGITLIHEQLGQNLNRATQLAANDINLEPPHPLSISMQSFEDDPMDHPLRGYIKPRSNVGTHQPNLDLEQSRSSTENEVADEKLVDPKVLGEAKNEAQESKNIEEKSAEESEVTPSNDNNPQQSVAEIPSLSITSQTAEQTVMTEQASTTKSSVTSGKGRGRGRGGRS